MIDMNYIKKLTVSLMLLMAVTCVYSQERPKLVVGIVVDQMRWDYLYRYYDRYAANGGFKRLMNNGFNCQNTMINYIPSFTAVGHSSIYTGSVPSIHGITGNSFVIQQTGALVSAVRDDSVRAVGTDNQKAGQVSPKNLHTTTITDELELATNFRAKVVGVSLKDRGSIFPAGHCADAAFWLDEKTGNWITSSWYMDTLPKWVSVYNKSGAARNYLERVWNPLYPIRTYVQSAPADNEYENPYTDKASVKFPINFKKLFDSKKNGYGLLKESPVGNTMTCEFAKMAVRNYRLGEDTITDFLTISFSAPDYVGHRYSPNSIKTEDIYLRLDADLASLMDFLDTQVGKDQYLLFITADHGGAHNVRFMRDNKLDAAPWFYDKLNDTLNAHLEKKFGKKNIVLTLENYQVNLNYSVIKGDKEKTEIIDECIDFFARRPEVAYVVENAKAYQAAIPAVIKEKIINGYNRQRAGEIQIILQPHYYSRSSWKGTTHGTWNPYDAHIPLIFYGKGIPKGQSVREVYMTDIAPTLAALLHIQMPSGCIGRPIEDLFKK